MVNEDLKFSLKDNVSLVTGAAGLLGKEHCLALAELGSTVVVTDLSMDAVNKAIDAMKAEYPKGNFFGIELDVTQEESIVKCLETIVGEFDRLDVLVNNAAIDPKFTSGENSLERSRLENFELSDWTFQVNVGLTGAMLCSKHFGSYMAKNGGGTILNISSDLSVFAPDQRIYQKEGLAPDQQPVKPVTYSVIKHGLVGLTKYLSTYWADKNVRVNALSPGGVFNDHPESFVNKLGQLVPLGRMAEKSEYRPAVQFLCSSASSYMTGQNIVMDGGRSVW